MRKREAILAIVTVTAFSLLATWNPCLLTFCKTISAPEWVSFLFFVLPIPFGGDFLIAGLFMAPLILSQCSAKVWLLVAFISPALISLIKHLPKTDPKYLWGNIAIDYVLALIFLLVSSGIIYGLRKVYELRVARVQANETTMNNGKE